MALGVISKIIPDKGIGFIAPCGPGRDVFFHSSVVTGQTFDKLREGQAVSYELDPSPGTGTGPRAAKVERCDQKLLGRKAAAEEPPPRHPHARRRKPTWRE